ncbi:hypothetical protein ACIBSV_41120 [Embleya sp. NPDC050154]|uniref:hypothetical protein n=1 Tax=Embleya sp. NPDC050154 TaxID=3363988 RepID=UPI0037BC044B
MVNQENTRWERLREAASRAREIVGQPVAAPSDNVLKDKRLFRRQLDDLEQPDYWRSLDQGLRELQTLRTTAILERDSKTLAQVTAWAAARGRFPHRTRAALARPGVTAAQVEVGENWSTGPSQGFPAVRKLILDTFRDADAAADRQDARTQPSGPQAKSTLRLLDARLAPLRTLLDSDNSYYSAAASAKLGEFRTQRETTSAARTPNDTPAPSRTASQPARDTETGAGGIEAANKARLGLGAARGDAATAGSSDPQPQERGTGQGLARGNPGATPSGPAQPPPTKRHVRGNEV